MDDVETELVEVRANYDVVLDRALAAGGTAEGDAALREAQPLRARISSLESEAGDLRDRRERLSTLVASVEERDRERRRLVDQIESSSPLPDDLRLRVAVPERQLEEAHRWLHRDLASHLKPAVK